MEPLRRPEAKPVASAVGDPGVRSSWSSRVRAGLDSVGEPRDLSIAQVESPAEDNTVMSLLGEVGLGARAAENAPDAMDDLAAVLYTDYGQVRGLPSPYLLHELEQIVESKLKPCVGKWRSRRRAGFDRLEGFFARQEILVHSQPYLDGAGRALWGFSCDARTGGEGKFVIFLNTAHDPGAVAATIGHELGHYIYNSIVPEEADRLVKMASLLSEHLHEEKELFSDSVVALSAYTAEQATAIADRGALIDQVRGAIALIAPQYRIALNRSGLSADWRIRYLTLIVHFFKLRCALVEAAGV